MNAFDLAIAILVDSLMETLPDNTDYLATRTMLGKEIQKAIQNTSDKIEGKE